MAGVPQSTRSLAGPINHVARTPLVAFVPRRSTNGQRPSPRTRFRDKRRPARRIKQTLLEYFMLECVRYLSAVRRINKVDYLRGHRCLTLLAVDAWEEPARRHSRLFQDTHLSNDLSLNFRRKPGCHARKRYSYFAFFRTLSRTGRRKLNNIGRRRFEKIEGYERRGNET